MHDGKEKYTLTEIAYRSRQVLIKSARTPYGKPHTHGPQQDDWIMGEQQQYGRTGTCTQLSFTHSNNSNYMNWVQHPALTCNARYWFYPWIMKDEAWRIPVHGVWVNQQSCLVPTRNGQLNVIYNMNGGNDNCLSRGGGGVE